MSTSTPSQGRDRGDGCADLRAAVTAKCEDAHLAEAAFDTAAAHVRDIRRDVVTAQHTLADAEGAANPDLRAAEKAAARQTYEHARREADDAAVLADATATWAQALDRINRNAMLAQRELGRARSQVDLLQRSLREAEQAEQAARMQAETAEADCLDARVLLASCEEQGQTPAETPTPDIFDPHAATGGHAVAITATGKQEPLVIESMVSGDRRALELAAGQVAEHTGLAPAQARLQLQELVDAITSVASTEGFLLFDTRHPFWAALSFEESRDVIAALARLGFQFEPSEGWHAGRAPAPLDLSMALAYAGLDPRNMRDLPSAEALALLPQSISVDGRALLAAQAPDLTVDHVVHMLGRRAAQLEPLWDQWGQIRPILLSPRRDLGSLPG